MRSIGSAVLSWIWAVKKVHACKVPLRIIYAAGPGNIINSFVNWEEGRDDPSEQSVTYSSQFFEVWKKMRLHALVLSSFRDKQQLKRHRIEIVHQPPIINPSYGLRYHLSKIVEGIRLVVCAVRFRADVVVVSSGTTHWFVLALLRLFDIVCVASLHAVLWPPLKRLSLLQRAVIFLDSTLFFRNHRNKVVSISEAVSFQVGRLSGPGVTIYQFLPTFRRQSFSSIPAPSRDEFRILYVGRVEIEKGALDLVEIAERLKSLGHVQVPFDVCGAGSALEDLARLADAKGLGSQFRLHGHCDKVRLRPIVERASAIIVPTRSSFGEGLNKSVVEGKLFGRPVVTSVLSNVQDYIRTGIVFVKPDDVEAYATEIALLINDADHYKALAQSKSDDLDMFFDFSRSWGSAIEAVLRQMLQPS